ncbi:MAG TPA: type II toxin-antitoxin system VapC family toxin [Candidatus Limnocylindrales bacterium]
MTIYADASALVKIVTEESGSSELRSFLDRRGAVATSIVGAIELRRAGRRIQSDVSAEVDTLLAAVIVLGLDEALASSAGRLGPPGLRTLDSIHLATAAILAEDLEVLVTYDRRLAEAATALGMPVVSPGA